ncbi:hypothetical protein Hanom_Chr03g00255091 [Helianthus anomalus]
MMKKKALEDKKRKLDEQDAPMLASKRARLQKEASPAPSESEIDLEVFTAKRGNLLEEIFVASGSRGGKPGKASRKIDISKITPPTSPPSRTFYLSPSRDDPGDKRKPDDVEVEHVGEGGGAGGAGDAGGADRGKGVKTEVESSEATPHQTIYTKRPPGSGGGGVTYRVAQGPEFENIRAGSWDTHNPACDDLPHAPRWNLTQGSQMNELDNCREVNFFATSQEIVREWKLRGEETLEFEKEKKAFAEEKEKFNAEKKGLLWRVSDPERKLAQKNRLTPRSRRIGRLLVNAPTRSCRHNVKRLFGYLVKNAREEEYLQRIAKLKKFVDEKVSECKASELLAEEVSADCRWLLSRSVPLVPLFQNVL